MMRRSIDRIELIPSSHPDYPRLAVDRLEAVQFWQVFGPTTMLHKLFDGRSASFSFGGRVFVAEGPLRLNTASAMRRCRKSAFPPFTSARVRGVPVSR